MSYTIVLDKGRFTVINDDGLLEFLENGHSEYRFDALNYFEPVLAMAERIEELEKAIRAVTDGTLDENQLRRPDGMKAFPQAGAWPPIYQWQEALLKTLEQKP